MNYEVQRMYKVNFSDISHLPPRLSHLQLHCHRKVISFSSLPPSLSHLVLFNASSGDLSSLHISYLTLSGYLPSSLKYPSTIYHMTVNCIFPAKMTKFSFSLPKSLKILHFGERFNVELDTLPNSLTHLVLGQRYNKSLDNLPPSLTHLTLGNQQGETSSTINILPSLVYLSLTNFFSGSIDNLPSSLQTLILNERYRTPIHHLPPSLLHLELGIYGNKALPYIPSTLQVLHFSPFSVFDHPINNLPSTITSLKFGDQFDQPVDNLPPNLIFLEFGDCFDQPVTHLPSKVIEKKKENVVFDYLIFV